MPPGTDDVKSFKEFVPAEFHDRGYLKDLLEKPDSPETRLELFKKLDGAETIVGKKNGIPSTDADADWDPFLAKLRPGKAEDYEMPGIGEQADGDFIKEMRAAMHEGGIGKVQAKRFLGKLIPSFKAREAKAAEAQKTAAAEQKRLDDEFDTLTKATFGAEGEKTLARVQKVLAEHTPNSVKPHLAKLDNGALTILSGVIDALLKKYAPGEDSLNSGNANTGGATDAVALREEGRKLMMLPEWTDAFHPQYANVHAKANDIYKKIAALEKK